MLHPNEPKLADLKEIQKGLFSQDSTDENLKKIKALEKQIQRHEELAKVKKVSAKETE